MTTDNFCFYLQNRLIQTSQTGGQWYSDTSFFSIPWDVIYAECHYSECRYAECRGAEKSFIGFAAGPQVVLRVHGGDHAADGGLDQVPML
jgi:hypothetical protein